MGDAVDIEKKLLARLICSAGLDDMVIKCDECGAWLYRDEPGAIVADDWEGCVWSATRLDADVDTCFRNQPARMVREVLAPPSTFPYPPTPTPDGQETE